MDADADNFFKAANTPWPLPGAPDGDYVVLQFATSFETMPEAVEVTGPPGTVCFWHGQLVHTGSQTYGKEIRMALISRLRRIDNDDILFESPDDIWEYYEWIE